MRRLRLTSSGVLLILASISAGGIFLLDVFYLQKYTDGQKDVALRSQAVQAEHTVAWGLQAELMSLRRDAFAWSQHPRVRQALSAEQPGPAFAEFARKTFPQVEIDLAWHVDSAGEVVNVWTDKGGGRGQVSGDLRRAIGRAVERLRAVREPRHGGVLMLAQRPVIFARQPIAEEAGGFAPTEDLWLCRDLDARMLAKIASVVSELVLVTPYGPPALGQWVVGEDSLMVAWAAVDALGETIGHFRAASPVGNIYRQAAAGRRTVLIVLSLTLGLSTLVILGVHMLIVAPVTRLMRRVQALERGEGSVADLASDLHVEPRALARGLESVLVRLSAMSKTDTLTGLANRRHFEQVLERFYYQARRYGRPLSVIVMDLDFFKAVNDTGGHDLGDELLRRVARTLQQTCRQADLPARFGGDEFAVLLPETSADDAATVADRIRQAVCEHAVGARGVNMNVTVSIGLADLDSGRVEGPQDMLTLADRAMYAAKQQGRNRFVLADEREGATAAEASRENLAADAVSMKLAELDTDFKALLLRAVEEVIRMLEHRDQYMANHARKVQHYAALIARQMELPDGVIKRLQVAAMLHDVGMLAMPDTILLCPMGLDGEQVKLMRRHPLLGARIMESMGFLDQEVPAVRHHHERYDGTGYPDGLAGPAIPLLARIVAVADSFDAMTSPRTFRRAKTIGQTVAELRANAGTQFDPGVVDAALAVAERMGEKLLELDAPPIASILEDLVLEPAAEETAGNRR